MSIEVMAAAAVGAIAPYLAKGAEKAAESMGAKAADGAGRLLGWLRERLLGKAGEALEELAEAPEDAGQQTMLRIRLEKALAVDPALAGELERLLAAMPELGTVQTMSQTGQGHKGAQVSGSGNTVKIG
jgi:hypothetical protein